MIVAVHQPQYLPWLGYFHKIDRADHFVLLDNVQFKKNEWQNRNKIKTAQGWQWLTVPVLFKHLQLINEVLIDGKVNWQHKQRQAIISNYKKAGFYGMLEDFFENTFSASWDNISQLNIETVKRLVSIPRRVILKIACHTALLFDVRSNPSKQEMNEPFILPMHP